MFCSISQLQQLSRINSKYVECENREDCMHTYKIQNEPFWQDFILKVSLFKGNISELGPSSLMKLETSK